MLVVESYNEALTLAPSGKPFEYPPILLPSLFENYRYKIVEGGRGSGKSTGLAQYVVQKSYTEKHFIGCFRELQNSIKDSVHKLICDVITGHGLAQWFYVTDKTITSRTTGSEFTFKGLRLNASEIKSMEGLTIVWVEEAHLVAEDSWKILIPTVRKKGSEMLVSYNPEQEEDPTHQRFSIQADKEIARARALNRKPRILHITMNWRDNPWFEETELPEEREYLLRVDPESYDHIWEGKCKKISNAVIFRNRYVIEPFDEPNHYTTTFYHGVDWGFADDPSVMIRCFITGEGREQELWIDKEVWGLHIEIDRLEDLFDRIETSRSWPSLADNSRPETISYLRGRGFAMEAADKWPGSVEDGVEHLRAFKMIHIHPSCVHTSDEFRKYSYKVDKQTNLILPVIVDKDNHCIDATRYALDGMIKSRSALGVWGRL